MSPLAPTLATLVIVYAHADVRPAVGRLAADRGWAGALGIRRLLLRNRALVRRPDALPVRGRCGLGRCSTFPPWPGSCCSSARASRRAARPISLLDSAIGALAISAAGAALAFGAIVDATGGSQLAIATNLAYPLGDLAVVAIMVGGLATTGWRLGTRLDAAAGRLPALRGRGHLVRLPGRNRQLQRRHHQCRLGGLLGSRRACHLAAVGRHAGPRPRTGARSSFPATFGAVGLGVLVYDHFRPVHLLALALATACVAAVIARMSLIFQAEPPHAPQRAASKRPPTP